MQYNVFVIMQGIPTLVLLDENDEVITTDGRSVIMKDLEGKVSTPSVFLVLILLARDSMLSALYAIARPSVCLSVRPSVRPSVCPSHWWISRKRLKLGSCNFHRTVAPSL